MYPKNVVYSSHHEKMPMKMAEVVPKPDYVNLQFFPIESTSMFDFSATLFSEIPRTTFDGKVDEIESIKQTFADFLKKVIQTSRSQDQDERYS